MPREQSASRREHEGEINLQLCSRSCFSFCCSHRFLKIIIPLLSAVSMCSLCSLGTPSFAPTTKDPAPHMVVILEDDDDEKPVILARGRLDCTTTQNGTGHCNIAVGCTYCFPRLPFGNRNTVSTSQLAEEETTKSLPVNNALQKEPESND